MQGDIMRFIAEFHKNERLTKGLKSTFIASIPKVDSPQHEARRSKKDLLLFKVDFEKAYDSVDWGYLDAVMGRMSFPTLWRKWIKECVCTATTSILVNGSPTDEFPLERGLRQGEPLSPFLFLMAAEGIHVFMEAIVERNLFTGYNVGEATPVSVSHLQFADDTLLMGTKSCANVRDLRAVLVLFERMSGLKVNFHKSMLVGVNITDSWLGEAASVLSCRVGKIPFLYSGLPIGGDPRRLSFWEPEYGVLGVRQLREFNFSLLGKWRWRMLVDMEGLWFQLLAARYGLESGRLCEGGTSGSVGVAGKAWDHSSDRWHWLPDLGNGYTVQGFIWHPQVPLKVSILTWRLLRDRLPTKVNLITRDTLPAAAHFCVSVCGAVESAQHLFLSCSTFGSLWASVSSWIGSSLVTAQTLSDHLVQFTSSAGGARACRSFMQLIWLACVWVVWTEQNHRLF
ncbi:hypothetical protein TSUD_148290 [Trifolium subterraneum]|uniref:Reverse transcriptase domain-containing protein n=1 Tax=Trifolium subterraneum TaxID=3900 RepID=A0A2Z6N1I6_TRISU|nr:hypothetical protein TSUD_148290 [Trifolium subterraneum]